MKHKLKLIIGIIVIILIVVLVFVVQKQKTKNHQDDIQVVTIMVKSIQDKVELIDLEKNYETKVLNNEKFLDNMTDGGGQLTGYFKDGKIVKIVERLGLSYGVKTYEYYFANDELLLVKEKEEDFPDTENNGTLDYTKVELAFEGNYYFNSGKMIDSQTEGQKRFSDGISENMNTLVTMAQENIQLLKAR
jgi:hypothetical protein